MSSKTPSSRRRRATQPDADERELESRQAKRRRGRSPDSDDPNDPENAGADLDLALADEDSDEDLDDLDLDEDFGSEAAASDDEGDEGADEKDDFVLKPSRSSSPALPDSLHLYMREVSRFPVLEPDEEVRLAKLVQEHNDPDAAFRLVSSHLRLVVKIAMDFQRRWMQNALDLIQEGNVGLMRAVQKFDPDKGIKFSYYAAFWIKAYILKYIMDNWRMVKIGTTQTQRKLFYNLNKERQRLQTMGFDPTVATLSEKLGVSEEEITEMDQRLSKSDMSLDVTYGDDSTATRLDFLPSLGPGVEETLADGEISGLLEQHLTTLAPELNDKERDILQERLLSDSPVTLREIGERYGITRERVRQIEARLLEKIREHLSEHIADFSPEWIRRDND